MMCLSRDLKRERERERERGEKREKRREDTHTHTHNSVVSVSKNVHDLFLLPPPEFVGVSGEGIEPTR